jgi:signal peptidase I
MEQFETPADKEEIAISSSNKFEEAQKAEEVEGKEETKENPVASFIKELPLLVIIAFVVAWLIKSFIIQPFYIPSGSMEPTFVVGDHVLVNKFVYRFTKPARGEVIVFRYPLDPSKDYIKRIVGFPGETVEIKNSHVYISGKKLNESYAATEMGTPDFGPIKVPANKLFVLGDNRNNSADSRAWGMLPGRNILGKAIFLYWPPDRIGLVK